jgi:hypothetical protein
MRLIQRLGFSIGEIEERFAFSYYGPFKMFGSRNWGCIIPEIPQRFTLRILLAVLHIFSQRGRLSKVF